MAGNDANAGTISAPFATLEGAQTAIRAYGTLPTGGVIVWIRGGSYERTNTFTLTASDTGTALKPIVYRGYAGESARLIGGYRLTGLAYVTGAITNRMPVAFPHVLTVGVSGWSGLSRRGYGITTPIASHSELFYAGVRQSLASYPNAGTWDAINADSALSSGLTYTSDHPGGWVLGTNIWVHGYWNTDYADSYEYVSAWNTNTHHLTTLAPYGLTSFKSGQRFRFVNVLEELDTPGEWYLDYATSNLYCWPPDSYGDKEMILSTLTTPLIRCYGANYITFQALVMEDTCESAVRVEYQSSDISVVGCVIRNIGTDAIYNRGLRLRVTDCNIRGCGEQGVFTQSAYDATYLVPGSCVISNCVFSDQGNWCRTYRPAIFLNGMANSASYNVIQTNPHSAILLDGNEHVVTFNDISTVCTESGDAGAIYINGRWHNRKQSIQYNYLHNLLNWTPTAQVEAIYLDQYTSECCLIGNVINGTYSGIEIGGGRSNLVANNIFVGCSHDCLSFDNRGCIAANTNTLYTTVWAALNARPTNAYVLRYPDLVNVFRYQSDITISNGIPAEGNIIATNLAEVGLGWGAWYYTSSYPLLSEISSTILTNSSAHFIDASAGDFRLQEDSPAFANGFVDIPMTSIGIHSSEARTELVNIEACIPPIWAALARIRTIHASRIHTP